MPPSSPARTSSPWSFVGFACVAVLFFALGWISRPAGRDAGHARPTTVSEMPIRATPAAAPASAVAAGGLPAAIHSARRGADRATQLYDFARRLRETAPGEYPALLQALRRTRSPELPEMLAMLCSAWAEHDGPGAFAAGRTLAAADGEYQALRAAITSWARRDPAAAQKALAAAGMTDLSTDELSAFVEGWAGRDFAAAEKFLAAARKPRADGEESDPAAVQAGYLAVARARLEADPAAALQWYAGLDESLRARLRHPMLNQLAASDPQAANRWLSGDTSAQAESADLIPLMRGLELTGFDQQFAWAQTLANGNTREAALAAVVREGATQNLLPLGEWLAARTDDPRLSAAFSSYAIQVTHKSPAAAVTWAQSLDNPVLRQQTLEAVASVWMGVNMREAREWAQRTRLVDLDALAR